MHGNTAVVNNLDKNEGSRFQAHLDLGAKPIIRFSIIFLVTKQGINIAKD